MHYARVNLDITLPDVPYLLKANDHHELEVMTDTFLRLEGVEDGKREAAVDELVNHERDHARVLKKIGAVGMNWTMHLARKETKDGGVKNVTQLAVSSQHLVTTTLGLSAVELAPDKPSFGDRLDADAKGYDDDLFTYRLFMHNQRYPDRPYPVPRRLSGLDATAIDKLMVKYRDIDPFVPEDHERFEEITEALRPYPAYYPKYWK